MKNLAIFFALLCTALLITTSCNNQESVEKLFYYDYYDSDFPVYSDRVAVDNYFTDLGLPPGKKFVVSGRSFEDCDEKAKSEWFSRVRSIKVSDIDELLDFSGSSFTYALMGSVTSSEPEGIYGAFRYQGEL